MSKEQKTIEELKHIIAEMLRYIDYNVRPSNWPVDIRRKARLSVKECVNKERKGGE